MDAIEPHWVSLLWFAGFATVGTLAFLMVCRHVSAALAPGHGKIERGHGCWCSATPFCSRPF